VKLIFQAAPLWWKAAQLLTTAGPAALLALPSAAAMTFVAVTPPVSNHPGDDSLLGGFNEALDVRRNTGGR